MTRWQYTFLQWRHEFFNICGKWINHLVRYTSQERKIGHLIKITYSSWNVKFPLSLDIQAKNLITLHQLLLWRKSPAFFKKKKFRRKTFWYSDLNEGIYMLKTFQTLWNGPNWISIFYLVIEEKYVLQCFLLVMQRWIPKNWLHAICKI